MNSTASQSSSSGCVGGSPLMPKSSDGADEAAAEQLGPPAVDRDAGRQRVVAVDQPAGQVEAVGAARRGSGCSTPGVPGCDFARPGVRKSPRLKTARRPRLGQLLHHQRRGAAAAPCSCCSSSALLAFAAGSSSRPAPGGTRAAASSGPPVRLSAASSGSATIVGGQRLAAGSPVMADSRSRPMVRPPPKFCTSVKVKRRARRRSRSAGRVSKVAQCGLPNCGLMAQAVFGSSSIAPATSKFACEKLGRGARELHRLGLPPRRRGGRDANVLSTKFGRCGVAAAGTLARQRRIGQRLQLEAR